MGFGIATQTGVSAAIQSIPSMMANKGLRNGYGATFAENFTDGTNTLDPRITFSRASNATITGSNGLIQYAPNNLLLNSEQFDASYWVKENVTVTANTTVAPDGTTTADSVVAAASGYTNFRKASITSSANTLHTASIYVKAGTGATTFSITLVNNTFTSGVTSVFNLSTGAVTSTTPIGTATSTSSTITAVGSGWYRVTSTAIVDATSTSIRVDYVMNNFSSTIYAWGAQLNVGSLQPYYPTTVKNLLGYSEAFDNAAWTKSNSTVSANTTVTAAPNGTFTADKLVSAASTSTQLVQQSPTTINTTPATYSIYVKAAEYTFVRVRVSEGSPFNRAVFIDVNLTTGATVRTNAVNSAVLNSSSVTDVGNGWYRIAINFTLGGSATTTVCQAYLNNGTDSFNITGDGTSGIYIWGAQLSDSASLDTYVNNPVAAPTAAAYYGPRFDYDPVTLQPKGLLIEEQRTNLFVRSEEFDNASWTKTDITVTANAAISPDGTQNADSCVLSATTSSKTLQQSVTTSATSYAYSVYVKSNGHQYIQLRAVAGISSGYVNFDIVNGIVGSSTTWTGAINSVGNGWYRITALTGTVTAATGNLSIQPVASNSAIRNETVTGDGVSGFYAWGAQLEAGAFATSYIPTTASQVTRSADVALIQGSNFSGWYNVNQGSFVTNTQLYNATARNSAGFDVQDGTTNNRIIFRAITTGSADQMVVRSGGITVATLSSASVSTPARKTGMGVKLDDFAMTSQGGDIYSDNSGAMPVGVSQMLLGSATGGAEFLNGYIRSIAYYPTRLQNSQLQAVTQ